MIQRLHLLGNIFMYVKINTKEKRKYLKKDTDKAKYIEILKDASKRSGIKIVSYTVLKDCVYLIIYSEDSDLIYNYLQLVDKMCNNFFNYKLHETKRMFDTKMNVKSLLYNEELLQHMALLHQIPKIKRLSKHLGQYKYTSYCSNLEITDLVDQYVYKLICKQDEANLMKVLQARYTNIGEIDSVENISKVVKNFLRRRAISFEELRTSRLEIQHLLAYMIKINCKIPKSVVAKYLGMSNSTFYRTVSSKIAI